MTNSKKSRRDPALLFLVGFVFRVAFSCCINVAQGENGVAFKKHEAKQRGNERVKYVEIDKKSADFDARWCKLHTKQAVFLCLKDKFDSRHPLFEV